VYDAGNQYKLHDVCRSSAGYDDGGGGDGGGVQGEKQGAESGLKAAGG